jgi:hypothetical protein
MRYWRAENKIVSGLKQLMRKDCPELEIDFDGYKMELKNQSSVLKTKLYVFWNFLSPT